MKEATKTLDTWYCIVNPEAGNGAVKIRWPKIESTLKKKKFPFIPVFTKEKGHATHLCTEAIEKGYRKIMAVGGDGTNNEVINGIMQQKKLKSDEIMYALLPIGTGNDWRRTHNIPSDINTWLEMIKNENTSLQDIGVASYFRNGRQKICYFANVAGMAYDAFVVKYSESNKKWVSNKLMYLFLTLKCLFQYKLQKSKVTFDGQEEENYFYTINAGICKYSGGGMQIVPHAIPNDGLLALTLARKISKLEIILNTYRFYTGTIDKHSKIFTTQAKHIRVEATGNEAVPLEVDGEFLGETPVEFSILEKALRVVVS